MKKILNKFGLFYRHDESSHYSYNPHDYQAQGDEKKSEAHKNYLRNLVNEETSRLTLIEGKTSQLISQTGIIFSLLSLFVPILVDKMGDLDFVVKLLLLLLLVLAFFFYMLTIRNALKNFNVKTFIYSNPAPTNVLDLQKETLDEFYAEEVRDLLYAINNNVITNNKKASNLLHSYNSFKLANTLTGILVVFFSIVLLFFKQNREGITIEKSITIENFDTSVNRLVKAIASKKDTIYLKKKEPPKRSRNPKG